MPETDYSQFTAGSEELSNLLVQEHIGWAEAIARNVARAWNLDWQLDGLDGGAFEALLFCARRFDPKLGVPFRAYARKRIHEVASEEARKSKAWQRGVGAGEESGDNDAREISFRLFDLFPELREGYLPAAAAEGEDDMRGIIRQLLTSASVISAFNDSGLNNPESAVDYKAMLEHLAALDPIHQAILWAMYWEGQSMRSLAETWGIDELTVIREHKEILSYVYGRMSTPKGKVVKRLKIRPSLRAVAQNMRKQKTEAPFARFMSSISAPVVALFLAIQLAKYFH